MTERQRRVHTGRVLRTERLTPHMQRVVLGGDGLAEFDAGTFTDHYVKLLFPPAGVTYPEPFDPGHIRATLPREQWPVTRTYSVRSWDPVTRELALDFVLHGDIGLAARWSVRAQPGDLLHFGGPGGGYAPDPAADWHLLAGDESALPAIAAALERLPDGAAHTTLVEIEGPQDEQDVKGVTWLHRGGRPVGSALVPAVLALPWQEGVHAFVHGEAAFVKEIRRYLRVERSVPRERLSISGYWRLGHDEDGWQASKREWNARIEAEQEPAA
ncbi:siderophore-interacting protein [Dactylosporangium sp. AC04546]|uniref:siderophore-interacting protein n=1 Tax=Dactylosporangium sp. AC04546 TaxID=2862460 RepID=UPI001EDFD975|nr:siderophore-interacting protein [Dactylosporangium sp. AC04546]WVK87453.1 siderophore-interacting protein [Dactylosporangium sp. AC04546]